MTTQQEHLTYTYDRQGNMLSDGRNQYTYDDFGRLVLAVTAEGGIQKNCYDAEGLRTEMEENGRLVQFLYNEDREVVAEKDYSGNIIRYIRGLGLISSDSENAKTYYHYVSDEQGSVSHIIRGEDKESGVSEQGREQDRILNQYEYDAFGNTISCKEQVENRFRYQGEQYDPITRQYYLRARYYNPVIGRFIQEDTYYGDGLNLYEYCRNNTITYKDPTGHNICPTQRDLYHKYKEEGMSPQEAYQKMRKELGLDSKSGYKNSGVGNGNDPWRSYESGRATDFYVTPNGEVVPATGYRYMDSKYAEQTMESMSAPGSYFGFEKFNSASAAQDAFQISPEWSNCKLRGEFDTLQVIDEMYVPKAYGNKGPGLEPFTRCYPEYGKGCQQFIYKGTIYFKNVDIIED